MHQLILAIEGGGSSTRVYLGDDSGEVLALARCSPANPLYIRPEAYSDELRACLESLRAQVEAQGATLAVAGSAAPISAALVRQLVADTFGPVPFHVMSEGQMGLAVNGLSAGITLVAGTGSSCFAVGPSGESLSRGGYGPQFGDEGSAYWIGRRAIRAAARAEEGRSEATLLLPRMKEHFAVENYGHLLKQCVGNGHLAVPQVADFARRVFETARATDAAALAICAHAGSLLGALVIEVAQSATFLTPPLVVAPIGGVFHGSELILDPLRAQIEQTGLDFRLLDPVTEPGQGLLRCLARLMAC